MSLVIVAPETVAAAALDVARIGSSIGAANAAAAGSTTSVLAAGADEVSAAIATLFGSHAREYQAISTQVAAFHDRFAQTLSAAVGSYVSAEATNAAPLATLEHNVLNALNAPTQALLGRPLIGDGAAGAPGTGQAGGAGGILWGNGGNGGSGGTPGQAAAAPEPTVADQPGGATVAAGHPHGRAGAAVATVAVQQPAGPAVLSRPAVGAITDQRAPKNPLEASVDRGQQVLFHALRRRDVDRLRSRISPAGTRQRLHELGVKRRHLGAHRLIRLTMRPKQRRDCRGNLISTRGQHRGGRRQRRGVGLRQCRPDAR